MRTAIITGAAGGMGYATALQLLEQGYRVFGLDIHKPQRTTASQKETQTQHTSPIEAESWAGFEYIPVDLTKEASVQEAFEAVRAKTASVDCIIHMAGMYDLNSLVEMGEEAFVRIFNINLFGMSRVNRIFLPLLKKGSRILITSSELAPLDPLPFTGIYGITKAAVEKYAYSLRMELQLLGIKVIVLRPGAVDTGLLDVSIDRMERFVSGTKLYPGNAKSFKKIVDTVEARKIPPERIAEKVVKILRVRHPKLVYCINRNPLLLLFNLLPDRLQCFLIRLLLRQ